MKKKGFTLIELLAVIIILAIVAIVATPIILNVVNDARRSAGLSEAKMIYSGINNYCEEAKLREQLNGTESICKDGVTVEEVKEMVNLGNSKVTNVKYENGKVTELTVESNNKVIELQPDGTFKIDGETAGDPVTPPVEEDNDYADNSGANKPELYDTMVAVKHENDNWVVADVTEKWYDYDQKEWANAVVLNSGTIKNVGDVVSEDDIALWYVWIPRYKYQLFNANNGSVNEQLINVTFETGTASTGTVTCTTQTSGSGTSSETCTNAENGNWYTHPAFTFGEDELTGIWVGKFEISGTTSEITIKPNTTSLRDKTVSNFFTSIQNMSSTYNLTSYDSHMIKNMEWGATAYLSHSKYGRGITEVTINNKNGYLTGSGAYKTNTNQSTTANIYGIYDMSGGADEYVMGNMVYSSNEFYSSSAGFKNAPDSKYYDAYTYDASKMTHGRGKLGDATKETLKTFGNEYGGWHGDRAYFPSSQTPFPSGATPWFLRGGNKVNDSLAGVFSFYTEYGQASLSSSTRAVLTPSHTS